jgi:MFS transporter, Spinster family, sphingosine-1-phosphate transporter
MEDTTIPPTKEEEPCIGKRSSTIYVFFIMFSINFLNYLDRYISVGAANTIARNLHLNIAAIGFLASAFIIIYTIGAIPFGIWADRAKRHHIVAICVAIWSIATTLTAVTGTFAMLFLSRMTLGLGEAGYYPAGTALLSEHFKPAVWSRVQSWWTVGALIGLLIGFVLGGTVTTLFPGSWRLAFLLAGVPGLLFAFLAWRLPQPPSSGRDQSEADSTGNRGKSKRRTARVIASQFGLLLRIRTLMALAAMQALAFFASAVSIIYLPTYLQQKDTFALSTTVADIFTGSIVVVAGILGVVLGGSIADWLQRQYAGGTLLICGMSFLLSAPIFTLTLMTKNFIFFSIFCFLTIFLLSIYNGPSTAAMQHVVPLTLRASAGAVIFFCAHLFGDAFAPSVVGVLATNFDPTHGQHFLQNIAGQDIKTALLLTCPLTLFLAGLVGIFGSRWMSNDSRAASLIDLRNA